VLNEELLEGVPLLILANKQDLPNARNAYQIASLLGVRPSRNNKPVDPRLGSLILSRKWIIQETSALIGLVYTAIENLYTLLNQ